MSSINSPKTKEDSVVTLIRRKQEGLLEKYEEAGPGSGSACGQTEAQLLQALLCTSVTHPHLMSTVSSSLCPSTLMYLQ